MDARLRLQQALLEAHRAIPFYTRRKIELSATGEADSILAQIPLIFRKDLRVTLPKMWVSEGEDAKALLASGELSAIDAGESGRILFKRGAFEGERRQALASNPRTAAHLSDSTKRAILSVPSRGVGSCHSGDPSFEERREGNVLFLNSRQDPTFWTELVMDRMLDELAQHQTAVLEGDPFYIAVLARHARAVGRQLDVTDHILFTSATLGHIERQQIARVFKGTMIESVGTPEIPFLLLQKESGPFSECSPSTFIEYLPAIVPTPGNESLHLVVATTLERAAQPLVRFATGELVAKNASGEITSAEGAISEAVILPSGAIVSSMAIDRALSTIAEVAAFHAKQPTATSVEVDVVGGDIAAIQSALSSLLVGITVDVRSASAIAAEPNGRFKRVDRSAPLSLAAAFKGCEGVAP